LKDIIVVAGGCTDNTEAIVTEFTKSHHNVKLISEKERLGKSSSLNSLMKKVNNSLLVMIAGDNIPAKTSIIKLLREFDNEEVGAVSGRPIPINDPNTIWGYISHLIWRLHHEFCIRGLVKLTGEFCGFRSYLVNNIPENNINDDAYAQWLVLKNGFNISYAPKAISVMRGPDNIHEFIRQRRRIATGHLQLFKQSGRRFIPPTYNFIRILKISARAGIFRLNRRSVFCVPIAIILEATCHIMGRFDNLCGNPKYIWERLPSTKRIERPKS